MAKLNYYQIPREEAELYLKDFFVASASLGTPKEAENFFRNLFSASELLMLSRRVRIALMLLQGRTHFDIIQGLHAGTSTIRSVERWLDLGFSGYRELVRKAKKQRPGLNNCEDLDLPLKRLKEKYPAHYWLVMLLSGR